MQYNLIRSARRTLAVQIKSDGTVVVRAPLFISESRINAFIDEKSYWIEKNINKIRSEVLTKYSQSEIENFIKSAKEILPQAIAHFSKVVGVKYKKINIKKTRTLWGSCTLKGVINLNCLLITLPSEVSDYLLYTSCAT